MIDILIPTYNRVSALAVTLTALSMQDSFDFNIVIADQSDSEVMRNELLASTVRLLEARGCTVSVLRNLPRRGLAQQRQFLLDRATASHVLFLDDDLTLEPWVVGQMVRAMEGARCGFIGCPPIGLSYRNDVRPHQLSVEWWDGPVTPETVEVEGQGWSRHRLHNAANPLHLQRALALTPDRPRLYKVAWVGGCVLYDAMKLRECGGFGFWRDLPEVHAGEDVLAQLRVMARFGGAGLLPSGVYHQELPTTVPVRDVDAPRVLAIHE